MILVPSLRQPCLPFSKLNFEVSNPGIVVVVVVLSGGVVVVVVLSGMVVVVVEVVVVLSGMVVVVVVLSGGVVVVLSGMVVVVLFSPTALGIPLKGFAEDAAAETPEKTDKTETSSRTVTNISDKSTSFSLTYAVFIFLGLISVVRGI
jgi:hypothetical protein